MTESIFSDSFGARLSYYCLCGPPSARSAFVSRLCAELLRCALGDFQYIYTNEAHELVERLKQGSRQPSLLHIDFPDRVISRIITENGIPTVLVRESFEQVVLYCMAAWDMDLRSAVRLATHSLVALAPIAALPTIDPLPMDTRDLKLRDLANLLGLSLGIAVDLRSLNRMLKQFGDSETRVSDLIVRHVEHARKATALRSALSDDERRLLQEIGSGYQTVIDGRLPKEIVWPGSLFLRADQPAEGMFGAIDMMGPARIMSFGPYLHLTAGRWIADMRFFVSGNWSGNTITMEVTAGSNILAAGQCEIPAQAAFSACVAFEVQYSRIPIEVRSVLRNGAIEGTFRLMEIVMIPATG